MQSSKLGPCKECKPPKRKPGSGCHDYCEEYKDWKNKKVEESKRIKEAKRASNEIYNLHRDQAI